MKITQAQLDALYRIYQQWQNKTPHAIMPEEFEIVPDGEYRKGDYIMVSVGEGKLVLGIESDGYVHS